MDIKKLVKIQDSDEYRRWEDLTQEEIDKIKEEESKYTEWDDDLGMNPEELEESIREEEEERDHYEESRAKDKNGVFRVGSLGEVTPSDVFLCNFKDTCHELMDEWEGDIRSENPITDEMIDNKKFYAMDAYKRAMGILDNPDFYTVESGDGHVEYNGYKFIEIFACWEFITKYVHKVDADRCWVFEDLEGDIQPINLDKFISALCCSRYDLEEFKEHVEWLCDRYLKGQIFPSLVNMDPLDFNRGNMVDSDYALILTIQSMDNGGITAEDVDLDINDVDW